MFDRRTDSNRSNPDPDPSRVDLTTTLYGELRKLAAARMAGENGPQTLQATALVHEAWLRLGGDKQPDWENRTHLFAAVAETMRHILVDRARRRKRIRHGGGLQRVDLEAWNWERLDSTKSAVHDEALLAMHEALAKLASGDKQTAKLVELHFFAGLSVSEAAGEVDLPKRTAERRLAFARVWLSREVRRGLAV